MNLTVQDFIAIGQSLGVTGFILVFAWFWLPKIGTKISDATAWCGQQVLLPIRDAFVGNINILTAFVTQSHAALPVMIASQQQVKASLDELREAVISTAEEHRLASLENAKTGEKTRLSVRALIAVTAKNCPVGTGCPFQKPGIRDDGSDDFTPPAQPVPA